MWKSTVTAPEGVVLLTRIKDETGVRNICRLIRHGTLWFLPDHSLHVYYTPTEYQPYGSLGV